MRRDALGSKNKESTAERSPKRLVLITSLPVYHQTAMSEADVQPEAPPSEPEKRVIGKFIWYMIVKSV